MYYHYIIINCSKLLRPVWYLGLIPGSAQAGLYSAGNQPHSMRIFPSKLLFWSIICIIKLIFECFMKINVNFYLHIKNREILTHLSKSHDQVLLILQVFDNTETHKQSRRSNTTENSPLIIETSADSQV